MPIWAYFMRPLNLSLLIVGGVLLISMVGLVLFRRYILPRIEIHDGVNDAISGTVQAIGVFYGVTVGLIAVGVWNTWSSSADMVSREGASISSLYRDFGGLPEPIRSHLSRQLRQYTEDIIHQEWPDQRKGQITPPNCRTLDDIETTLMAFEPTTLGQQSRYAETLAAYNRTLQARSLRVDAVGGGLSGLMWGVIWSGAAISIGIAYFFHLKDFKLHGSLVGMMAGYLGIVLFLIVANDRPFLGEISIRPDSYQLVLDEVMSGNPAPIPKSEPGTPP